MNICHLTSVHSRHDVRIFYKECRSLVAGGYSVSLIVADGEGDESLEGVEIVDVGATSSGRFVRMTKTVMRVYAKAVSLNATLYHFHDPELIPVGILLRIRGKRVIYDVHEDLPRQILSKIWIPKVLRSLISFGSSCFEWFGACLYSGIVTVTPTIAKRFPTRKTVLVRNYPILDDTVLGRVLPYSDRPKSIVYVGGLTIVRGVREIIHAMDYVSDSSARLQLAGWFSPESLEREVRSLSGAVRTNFLGWQSRDQVLELLNQARVGLVTLHPIVNYRDAYPVKLFEYMAAGLPIIASDFPLWRQIIEDANCGVLVDPLDPKDIARAIQWFLDHPNEAAVMGENGRKAAFERFNWTVEEKKMLSLYRDILKQ